MMKNLLERIWLLMLFTLSATIFATPTRAAYIGTGDVTPADPASWTLSTKGYIGNTSDGSLIINSDSDLLSMYAYIGNMSTSAGRVTIDGKGSGLLPKN
jgi:hypothetical protein